MIHSCRYVERVCYLLSKQTWCNKNNWSVDSFDLIEAPSKIINNLYHLEWSVEKKNTACFFIILDLIFHFARSNDACTNRILNQSDCQYRFLCFLRLEFRFRISQRILLQRSFHLFSKSFTHLNQSIRLRSRWFSFRRILLKALFFRSNIWTFLSYRHSWSL